MGRKEKFVAFSDEEEIINRIDAVVADKGIDRSDFIREAIRKRLADLNFFSEKTKKIRRHRHITLQRNKKI